MIVEPPAYFNFARDVLGYWGSVRPEALALWCVDESGRNEQKFTFRQLAESHRRAAGFFHTVGIPTMWLVDKKGILRDLNAARTWRRKSISCWAKIELLRRARLPLP